MTVVWITPQQLPAPLNPPAAPPCSDLLSLVLLLLQHERAITRTLLPRRARSHNATVSTADVVTETTALNQLVDISWAKRYILAHPP
jgi:hypothetical protein